MLLSLRLLLGALALVGVCSPALAGGPIQPPGPVPGADCTAGSAVTGWPAYGSLFTSHCGTPVASGTINLGTVGLPAGYTGTGTLSSFAPGGDVSFATPNYTVTGLQGRPLLSTAPTTGQVLTWSGTAYAPAANSGGVGTSSNGQLLFNNAGSVGGYTIGGVFSTAGGTFSLAAGGVTNAMLQNSAVTINTHSLSLGGALTLAFSDFAGQIATGQLPALAGDVSSSAGSNVVTIAAGAVSNSKMAAGAAAANVGALGGDLGGTLPNPTVTQLQGRPMASTAPLTNQFIGWNGSSWVPLTVTSGINQLTGDGTAAGTGSVPLTLAASGVSAGSYQLGSYCATFDVKGRATSIVLATCGGGTGLTGGGVQLTGGGVNLIQ